MGVGSVMKEVVTKREDWTDGQSKPWSLVSPEVKILVSRNQGNGPSVSGN